MKKILLVASILLVLVGSSFAFSSTFLNANATSTSIQHVIVIFQENVSFDHYFGTYPFAANPPGEPKFTALPGTPIPNNYIGNPGLTQYNPNLNNPARIDRSQPITCDNDHGYTAEQSAYNGGLVNQFVQSTGCSPIVMDYYDGNTVTGLWEYANHFTLGDNFFGTTMGPSSPGAINLISGDTNGATPCPVSGIVSSSCTLVDDVNPTYDACSTGSTVAMTGQNIGDLLNQAGITWGWFEGGFAPSSYTSTGAPVCGSSHYNVGGQSVTDYIPHHEPFQYYKSTSNPDHLPPTSVQMVGKTDQANHQYDLSWFYEAAQAGNLPQVSFIKAPGYQDGHAGYSDPIDEQNFLVSFINFVQSLPQWKNTAIFITYDDSDGWYDQVMPPIVTQSNDPQYDSLLGSTGLCGNAASTNNPEDMCGLGPRLPLLVISPWAKSNYIFNGLSDQTSITKFIEDNWNLGRLSGYSADVKAGSLMTAFDFRQRPIPPLFLDPVTGLPVPYSTAMSHITYDNTTYTAFGARGY
jgi:phospholipase C